MSVINSGLTEQLTTLLGYLDSDPENLNLISDTAEVALQDKAPEIAKQLLTQYSALESLGEKQMGMLGLAAMQLKQFDTAAETFRALIKSGNADPAIYFNLAWSLAMLKDFTGALEVLDTDTVTALPQAAMLEIQLLHQNAEFGVAADKAKLHAKTHPDDPGLMAAISVLSLDIEDPKLARECALRAGNHPDALATLGTLALGDNNPDEALDLFDRALAQNAHMPRSWIGKGLVQMISGDQQTAAKNIDKGAEIFSTHIGSWIAAGWAHLLIGDRDASKTRFEKAFAIDHNFAESHGSLAVIDVMDGHIDKAQQGIKTALKLDRECFSALFAQTLLLSSQGKTDIARKIFDKAINTPIDERGRTIAQALVGLGLSN